MFVQYLRGTALAAALVLSTTSYAEEMQVMKRHAVNPVGWGAAYLLNQGEVIEGAQRQLHTSGQVALKEDPESPLGISVTNEGDLRGQMQDALASLDAILEQAGMSRSDITHLTFYTTDVDGFLANYDVYGDWIAPAGIMPTQSLLGVARLVLPEILVEIELTAAQ